MSSVIWEKKLEKMAQFLGWDESNFLRLQSMLGGAGTSMHDGLNVSILFQNSTQIILAYFTHIAICKVNNCKQVFCSLEQIQ